MREFRLLKADEIECRIGTISEKGLSLLLYKTARTDAKLLDETVGADRWQNDYKVINDNLYCGIGIKYAKENGSESWVWKWNCGVESNTEKEKGEASDALKRAGFTWGIGTELYSSPFIWIAKEYCNMKQNDKGKWQCNDRFSVGVIEYDDDGNINKLLIKRNNDDGYVFIYPRGSAKPAEPKPAEKPPVAKPAEPEPKVPAPKPKEETDGLAGATRDELKFICYMCGQPLRPYIGLNGKPVGVRQHAEGSKNKFGNVTCIDCMKKYGMVKDDNSES